jgi:hypothetical protein
MQLMAQNPLPIALPKGVWTMVAQSKLTGQIHRLPTLKGDTYLVTHRITGQAAPTDTTDAIYIDGQSVTFQYDTAVDMYVMAVDSDGKVRVDL